MKKCSRCKINKGIYNWFPLFERVCFECYNILMLEKIQSLKNNQKLKGGTI